MAASGMADLDRRSPLARSSFQQASAFLEQAATHPRFQGIRVSPSVCTTLDEVDRFRPDLVIVDVLLPGLSGLDLLVTLRRHPEWHDLPVVVVTGNEMVVQDECQSYLGSHQGVRRPDGILAKPIAADELLDLVRALTA